MGCGASIQDNNTALPHAKTLTPQIQSGGTGLFAIALAIPTHEGTIILRAD